MSFVPGALAQRGGAAAILVKGLDEPLPLPTGSAASLPDGAAIVLGIRPEHIGRAGPADSAGGWKRIKAAIELLQPTGSRTYATFRLGDDAGPRRVAGA